MGVGERHPEHPSLVYSMPYAEAKVPAAVATNDPRQLHTVGTDLGSFCVTQNLSSFFMRLAATTNGAVRRLGSSACSTCR